MLTLARPQSDPKWDRKGLGVAEGVGKDCRRQPLLHPVLNLDGLLERSDLDDIEDRGEGLILGDASILADLDHRRLDELV